MRPTRRRDDRKAKHPARALACEGEGDEPREYVGLVAQGKTGNAEALVKVIKKKFGVGREGETFTSRKLAEYAEADEDLWVALGGSYDDPALCLNVRRIGNLLGDIAKEGKSFDGCCIELVDTERHIAIWQISPSLV